MQNAIKQCRQQLEPQVLQAGIVFAGIDLDHALMMHAFRPDQEPKDDATLVVLKVKGDL